MAVLTPSTLAIALSWDVANHVVLIFESGETQRVRKPLLRIAAATFTATLGITLNAQTRLVTSGSKWGTPRKISRGIDLYDYELQALEFIHSMTEKEF